MRDLPKQVRRKLQDLCGLAYERALARALADLESQFHRWRSGEIDAYTLNELVHKYHQGPSREVWKRYSDVSGGWTDLAGGTAVAEGLLQREELPAEVLPYVERALEVRAVLQGRSGSPAA